MHEGSYCLCKGSKCFRSNFGAPDSCKLPPGPSPWASAVSSMWGLKDGLGRCCSGLLQERTDKIWVLSGILSLFWFLGSYSITMKPKKYILFPQRLLNSLEIDEPPGHPVHLMSVGIAQSLLHGSGAVSAGSFQAGRLSEGFFFELVKLHRRPDEATHRT